MRRKEAFALTISAVVLALVFSYNGIEHLDKILGLLPLSFLAVSIGFVSHELAHRFFAKRYGCFAEYQMWNFGLLLAVVLVIATNGKFIFAAPGAVMIYPAADLWGNKKELTKKQIGIVSIAGALMNLLLAGIFTIFAILFMSEILFFPAYVNIWLALFNLLPIPPLDGSKVFYWSKKTWLVIFSSVAVLFIFLNLI